ncbi:hypothetical protein [Tenacibaculum insulae]|uniref:hypothetical protein n=1 Tax=Tenacibaculum insulae TaxID=2029677 RepID=UPI003AB6C07A
MTKKLTFLLLFIISTSFSQEVISNKETIIELKKSSKSLNTNLILPKKEFYIGIVIDLIVENLEFNPCIEIDSNIEKNEKIIEILEEYNLLEKLYFENENEEYENIESNQKFEWEKPKLIIQLFFETENMKAMNNVFIPIFEKKLAKELTKKMGELFNNEYCFKKLKRKI